MDAANFSANERVDLADLNFAVQETPLQVAREPWAYFGMDPKAASPGYVVSGFETTNPAGNQVQVNLGVALLGRRVGLEVSYGLFTATGDATQLLDISSYQSGTYGVYIKFDQQLSADANRTFWQTTNGGSEYAESTPTRITSTWQMTVVPLSPGPEWLQIASVQMQGCIITDMRPLYFEGRVDQNYVSTWGQGSDRDSNRGANGVGDLQSFVSAMRSAIEDVKGPGLTRWWENKIGGQNIGFAGTPLPGRTAWTDVDFFAQGDSTAPYINFAPSSTFGFNRNSATMSATVSATQVLSMTASALQSYVPLTASCKAAPQAIVTTDGTSGANAAIKIQAASGVTSVLYSPGGTAVLFEQRATSAALSTLGTFAGTTLAGTLDSNANWVLGTGASGYVYPTSTSGSTTSPSYAALSVADTSGNHLLRLDSSGKSGVSAIASLRANAAMTAVRFTPGASTPASTYTYALQALGTAFSLYSNAAGTIFNFDTSNFVASFNAPVSATAFQYAATQGYVYHPSIYSFVGSAGVLLGGSNSMSGGAVVYQGGNGTLYWPLSIPDGSIVTSITISATRSHSGSSTASNNVTLNLSGSSGSGLSNALGGGTMIASNVYAPGWQPNTTTSASITAYNMPLNGLSASVSNNSGYYNLLLSFNDPDSAVITSIFKINVQLTRTMVSTVNI
jgi:hypothetical protein